MSALYYTGHFTPGESHQDPPGRKLGGPVEEKDSAKNRTALIQSIASHLQGNVDMYNLQVMLLSGALSRYRILLRRYNIIWDNNTLK